MESLMNDMTEVMKGFFDVEVLKENLEECHEVCCKVSAEIGTVEEEMEARLFKVFSNESFRKEIDEDVLGVRKSKITDLEPGLFEVFSKTSSNNEIDEML